MYIIGIIIALCFMFSGLLVGCITSPLRIASPEIVVSVGETDDSLRAGRGGTGLKPGRGGTGLKPGRGGTGLKSR